MNDNELDDLFRSNADYLAEQPPRDFDKDTFWQQLQTAIPQKNNHQKKPIVWTWAAAAVLLAGMFVGTWWMESETGGRVDKVTQKAEATSPNTNSIQPQPWSVSPQTEETGPWPKSTEQIARVPREINPPVSPQISGIGVGRHRPRMPAESIQQVPIRSTLPETLVIEENLSPEPAAEFTKPSPEIAMPTVPEKPHYRVVHINEIRERKQQEAKARTRLAFRIGLPSGTRLTTQTDHEAPLSIPIQN